MNREQATRTVAVLTASWELLPGHVEFPTEAEHREVLARLKKDEWMRAQRPRAEFASVSGSAK